MPTGRVAGGLLMALAVAVGEVAAQDVDRIWGRVETISGDTYEGFIRWDRNEGSWVDVLDGSKPVPRDNYRIWIRAMEGEEVRRVRTVELMGFRISWEESDPEFPSWAEAGIRFGQLRELKVTGPDAALLLLRNGQEVEFARGSTDLGEDLRELVVEDATGGTVELGWRDLDRIVFEGHPAVAAASARRLYGTAEDRWGNRYTGYVAWDLDEILTSDILDGEEGRRDRQVPFRRIAAIERGWGGARVTLEDGEEMVLDGSNDVGWGHRGVQISDPGLGLVNIPWDEFETIRFHQPDREVGYDAFDGGRPLVGTVITRGGESIRGAILWDADERWSWEMLNGSFRDVEYDVEFSRIDRIERLSSRGARVTLRDGRVLDLEDSNDVSDDNKGIFIAPEGFEEGLGPEETEWVLVTWDELDEVRFEHD
ncbi:MAG: hypothetical protein JSU98_01395 [Gemmatimonadales bacterium]|nr:MAG: hypothetical protein JSU98_01395 [Gemmatimonadales bacterium]